MKKFLIVVFLICATVVNAQTYHAPKHQKIVNDTNTTYKYEVNDSIYKVYRSKNDVFYIWRKSKKGKVYKYYLPKEVQDKIFFDELEKKRKV